MSTGPGDHDEADRGHRPGDWGGDPVPAGVAAVAPPGVVASPRPRLRAARAAVIVVMATQVLDMVTSVSSIGRTQDAIDQDPAGGAAALNDLRIPQGTFDRLQSSEDLGLGVGLLALVALIVAAVFVIRWQSVPLRNQRGLGVEPRFSAASAGWCWFVPIWNVFGPKQAYNDMWRAAEPPYDGQDTSRLWVARPVPGVITGWWAAWIGGSILSIIATRAGDDTLDGRVARDGGSIVGDIVTIVAGVLFLRVMREITDRHDERVAAAEAA